MHEYVSVRCVASARAYLCMCLCGSVTERRRVCWSNVIERERERERVDFGNTRIALPLYTIIIVLWRLRVCVCWILSFTIRIIFNIILMRHHINWFHARQLMNQVEFTKKNYWEEKSNQQNTTHRNRGKVENSTSNRLDWDHLPVSLAQRNELFFVFTHQTTTTNWEREKITMIWSTFNFFNFFGNRVYVSIVPRFVVSCERLQQQWTINWKT